ncbi:hypothetical protein SYNPS1DRAFT_26969 [Syncephalis pseudoplumigaleata]|uniref:Uncharacterized protein n=1 Tax=Syncephalis pseudoplumigaleata TaxID=1712513 RepID=A0A4P9Z4J3_9FUNG|nr:hypothetical protein SYNPS1DRAFT_26969 [Syncephalis pseudoplumigaleata]|eukprot:RKP27375.1 hypothetical protein SYNPS1DRAFT_26969 [Syncephalis pseudoplumigaleata]
MRLTLNLVHVVAAVLLLDAAASATPMDTLRSVLNRTPLPNPRNWRRKSKDTLSENGGLVVTGKIRPSKGEGIGYFRGTQDGEEVTVTCVPNASKLPVPQKVQYLYKYLHPEGIAYSFAKQNVCLDNNDDLAVIFFGNMHDASNMSRHERERIDGLAEGLFAHLYWLSMKDPRPKDAEKAKKTERMAFKCASEKMKLLTYAG